MDSHTVTLHQGDAWEEGRDKTAPLPQTEMQPTHLVTRPAANSRMIRASPNCPKQSLCLFFSTFLIFTFPLLHLTRNSFSNEQFLTAVLKLLQEKKQNIAAGLGQWTQKFFLLTKPERREILFQALCKLREFCTFFFNPGFWKDKSKISERKQFFMLTKTLSIFPFRNC